MQQVWAGYLSLHPFLTHLLDLLRYPRSFTILFLDYLFVELEGIKPSSIRRFNRPNSQCLNFFKKIATYIFVLLILQETHILHSLEHQMMVERSMFRCTWSYRLVHQGSGRLQRLGLTFTILTCLGLIKISTVCLWRDSISSFSLYHLGIVSSKLTYITVTSVTL